MWHRWVVERRIYHMVLNQLIIPRLLYEAGKMQFDLVEFSWLGFDPRSAKFAGAG
jgi:hypothetical protein